MRTPWTLEEDGRYWVVGGRYTDMEFRALEWSAPALGPFCRRAEAEAAWRRVNERHSCECRVRFRIVEEALAKAA